MMFYWLCNRIRQGHYLVYSERGSDNHPTKHHCSIIGTYLFPTADSSKYTCYQVPRDKLGCVKSPPILQATDDEHTRYPSPTNKQRTDGYRQDTRYRR